MRKFLNANISLILQNLRLLEKNEEIHHHQGVVQVFIWQHLE